MSGSFLPSLWSSINHSLLGSIDSIVMKSRCSHRLPKLWTLIRADLAKAQNTLSANAASHKALADYQEFLDHNELELACDMLTQIALLLATIQFDTQAVAAADSPKDLTAAASSSLTSKTVSSFPSCITARTFFVGLSSFNSPRRFRTLVKEPIR
jgi:hypothetical protein